MTAKERKAAFALFKIGDRVALTRVKSDSFRGKSGTVRKCVKYALIIEIVVDNPPPGNGLYRADPENIDFAAKGGA